jgi:type IV pilus assembly protein PilC
MKQYSYKAVNQSNQRVQGIVEAKNEKSAVGVLRSKGLLVIDLFDTQKKFSYKFYTTFFRTSGNDVVYFTRQFATMINSGLPMVNALHILKNKAKPTMVKVIDEISADVEGGETLYKAMCKHPLTFPPVYLALVRAGEAGGVLDKVLEQLAKNMERQREFSAKVKSALVYPMLVLGAMLVIGLIMVFFVMPKMAELYGQFEADLPIMTMIVFSVSDFIRNRWYILFPLIGGIVFGFMAWMKNPSGKAQFDEFSLKIPIIGELQHKVISTNVIRTLALMIRSGVSIVESLNIVANVAGNYVYQRGIENVARNVEKGIPLGASFSQENFLPEVIIQMMTVGEETGKLDKMLDKIAKQFEKDAMIALKTLTSAIEPALIIVLGVGVGFMVMAILMPIYNLTTQIK